jgi:cytochrome c-type biogenesis protein
MPLAPAVVAVTVESLSLSALLLAFAAGIVSFLSPCVLPLLPAYLSYLSGVGVDEIESHRGRVLRMALAFVAGFTVVFTALGVGAGFLGRFLDTFRSELTIVAGLFFIASGLVISGVVRLPALQASLSPRTGGAGRAFVAGAAVSLGWTPCVGYVLASILALAGARESAVSGGLLLIAFSIGLGVPFIAAALAYDWVMRRLAFVKRHYRTIERVAGALLVVFGILLLTDRVGIFNTYLPSLQPFGL